MKRLVPSCAYAGSEFFAGGDFLFADDGADRVVGDDGTADKARRFAELDCLAGGDIIFFDLTHGQPVGAGALVDKDNGFAVGCKLCVETRA